MAKRKVFTLENLNLYDSLLKAYINEADARALKTVALSDDGKKLLFYRVDEPVGETIPAYQIELPDADLSGLMQKLTGATVGDVLTVDANGSAQDSGVKLSDLAKTADVEEKIATAVSQAGHMKKVVVTSVPDAAAADENTFYLLKDDTVAGKDKYEVYVKIDNEMVMIDDTSVNLDGYYTKGQVDSAISTAKDEAINSATGTAATDAQTKADKALEDAKKYTDGEIGKANTNLSNLETKVTGNTNNITTLTGTVSTHSDKITALEGLVGEGVEDITESEIRALFN